jgi:hypothetical protein
MCYCKYTYLSLLCTHIPILRCATACIHIYLYCGYKLYVKMYHSKYTYISIVDRCINLKMCHCKDINRTEQGNMHTRTQVGSIPPILILPFVLSETMQPECAALCIVLVILSSTLSSCDIIQLPACTEALCRRKCLDYAHKRRLAVKNFYCVTANACACSLGPKQRLPPRTKVNGFADAEDHNGSFVWICYIGWQLTATMDSVVTWRQTVPYC